MKTNLDKLRERFKGSISFRANDLVICEAIKKDIDEIMKEASEKATAHQLHYDIKQLLDSSQGSQTGASETTPHKRFGETVGVDDEEESKGK